MGGFHSVDLSAAMPGLRDVVAIHSNQQIPAVAIARQRIDAPVVTDIEGAVKVEVSAVIGRSGRPPGAVAVGVGSRGIANLDRIVRCTVDALKSAGYRPFIVPAMGSHGGSTPEGQCQLLSDYGITEASMGVPVRATMDTKVIGEVDGMPIHMDRIAVETGSVFLVSRVKPHTDFQGSIESGLAKMCAIGLGKQVGAQQLHSAGIRGLRDVMPKAARLAATLGILVGGLAIVENQKDETGLIRGLTGEEVGGPVEEELLQRAYELLPRIPFDVIDVLVIDRMGKNISGAGMDTKVLNRLRISGEPEPAGLLVVNVAVLDLTPESHGNGAGIGLADFIPVSLAEKIDLPLTYVNGLTAGMVGTERLKLPVILPTARDAVLAAIAASGRRPDEGVRLAWIQDTLHTEVLAISQALMNESGGRQDLELVRDAKEMPFRASGELIPLEEWANPQTAAG